MLYILQKNHFSKYLYKKNRRFYGHCNRPRYCLCFWTCTYRHLYGRRTQHFYQCALINDCGGWNHRRNIDCLKEVIGVLKVVQKALFSKNISIDELIQRFIGFATKTRKEGILALESEIKDVTDDFLKKGVQLSIDGLEPQEIREILNTEVDYVRSRHQLGAEVFTSMGTFAPAMGMIGTLIGLVQMLQSMDDPSTIGPAMAVALLTTFYGSLMANLCCMPIAGKLKTRSKEEMLTKEMAIQGIISLSNGDNPRILEQKLLAFIPLNKKKESK